MKTKLNAEAIRELAQRFVPGAAVTMPRAFGGGHINDTFQFEREDGIGGRFVLQRINQAVFPHPEQVMDNILRVTNWLRERIREKGGDPERETLHFVPVTDGRYYTQDADGDYWRVYHFIDDSATYDSCEENLFAESGRAFGLFLNMLDGFDAASLHETIEKFHDTPKRFRDFHSAVERNAAGRAHLVGDLIDTALGYEEFASTLVDGLASGALPLRVTHNDTKLNNVLMDTATGRALCVIDLDTVMPGLSAYDFGDAIRFGASTALEDEQDLDKVHFSLPMFRAYTKAYLEQVRGSITQAEAESLPVGACMMTLECGIRFLGDYLNGDVYFKTAYPEHNLVRARTQFKLLGEMYSQMEDMLACVRECL